MDFLVKRSKNLLKNKIIRFVLSGGIAATVDIVIYFLCVHLLIKNTIWIGVKISVPVASLCVSFSAGLVTSFTINKFFVFKESELRTSYQFVRFFGVAMLVFVLNYIMMKYLLAMGIYPTVSRILSAGTVACISFVLHNTFSFKTRGKN